MLAIHLVREYNRSLVLLGAKCTCQPGPCQQTTPWAPTRSASDSTSANSQHHDRLSVAGTDIMYVELPADADTPELMRSRLRAIDQGRNQFRQRVKKKVPVKPIEKLAPLVSGNITEAVPELGSGLGL